MRRTLSINLVMKFTDRWNQNMFSSLVPGHIIIVDESMGMWKRNGMSGWMFIHRMPTLVGRESHTTADCDIGADIFVEPYEGKKIMKIADFVSVFGSNPSKALRCVRPCFGSGRYVILVSGFASFKCIKAMVEHGMHVIGNVKIAHVGFPKNWLLLNAPVRG